MFGKVDTFWTYQIHYEESTPCEDEKLNLYFYYGLDPLYQNALDGATGRSFVLSTPSCAAMTLRRIFGSFVERKKKNARYHGSTCFVY
jgi:hypothetical protein